MKVIFLQPHAGYAYFPGNEAELDDKEANKLIAGGYVRQATDEAPADSSDGNSNEEGDSDEGNSGEAGSADSGEGAAPGGRRTRRGQNQQPSA